MEFCGHHYMQISCVITFYGRDQHTHTSTKKVCVHETFAVWNLLGLTSTNVYTQLYWNTDKCVSVSLNRKWHKTVALLPTISFTQKKILNALNMQIHWSPTPFPFAVCNLDFPTRSWSTGSHTLRVRMSSLEGISLSTNTQSRLVWLYCSCVMVNEAPRGFIQLLRF